MHDPHDPTGIVPDITDSHQDQIWADLKHIAMEEPPEGLRFHFYERLQKQKARSEKSKWTAWFAQPLLHAAAALAVGLFLGLQMGSNGEQVQQIDRLSEQVAVLNSTVALTLISNESAADRLKGIQTLTQLEKTDAQLTSALLRRARIDDNGAVRRAAISALGPHLGESGVSNQVEDLLLATSSALDQHAVAELIIIWGDDKMVTRLIDAARQGKLAPDVSAFLIERMAPESSLETLPGSSRQQI